MQNIFFELQGKMKNKIFNKIKNSIFGKNLLKFYPGKKVYEGISSHLGHRNAFFCDFILVGQKKGTVIYTSIFPYSPSVGEEMVDEIE